MFWRQGGQSGAAERRRGGQMGHCTREKRDVLSYRRELSSWALHRGKKRL